MLKSAKPHLAALIEIINVKYEKLIQARKEEAELSPEVQLKREIRDIDKIKTRPGGDITVPPKIKSYQERWGKDA